MSTKIETAEAVADRSGYDRDSDAHAATLAGVLARDEQIVAWCEEQAEMADKDAARHAPYCEVGFGAVREHIDKNRGKSAAFRAVAAALKGARA